MTTQNTTLTTPVAVPVTTPTGTATVTPPTSAAIPPVTGVANGSNKGTKIDLQTSYVALIAGLLAYYQPGDEFVLSSGTMTRDALIASFQQFVATTETTKTSNLAWRNDVQNERAAQLAVSPLRAGVRSVLEGRFGKSGTELAKFGFSPAKAVVKSAATKTAAAVKAKATRAARGTGGKVQKKKITGNVTGVVITPVTAGASTAAPVATGAASATTVAQLPAAALAGSGTGASNGAGGPVAGTGAAATGVTPAHS